MPWNSDGNRPRRLYSAATPGVMPRSCKKCFAGLNAPLRFVRLRETMPERMDGAVRF
jgi:hypothetical protein